MNLTDRLREFLLRQKLMQRRLGQQDDKKETNEWKAKLELERNKNERLLQALEKGNELKAQIAELLLKQSRT